MNLKIILSYDYPKEISQLLNEYTNMLIENDDSVKEILKVQNYDDELKNLKEKYGLPNGRLYLAYYDEKLAECIALRKIDDKNCEMKRLFVKEEFRGKHIGSKMIEKIIEDAKEIGYKYMLLDTLPFLKSAIYLYKEFGFYEIESYNDNPFHEAIYMKLDL